MAATRFKLSRDARSLDFHQKTLLSDEFGIGFAGLVLEDRFGAEEAVDISIALGEPQNYQNFAQTGGTQPDYLMWSEAPTSPYFVVECKGSQTKQSTSIDQIRRGLEQVPSIVFGTGTRDVITLVIATCLQGQGTTIFIVDPPPGESEPPDRSKNKSDDKVSESLSESVRKHGA